MKLKELAKRKERFTPGHRLCAGCGAGVAVRQILFATEHPVVVCCPTGCLQVSTTLYPYTSWDAPYIHSAFENAAATIAGAEAAYKAFKKKINKEIKFVVFGGDGGTYDIGFQALSGTLERGHNIVYVCYDNEAYMNTGIQRSSSTPIGAWTTTTPVGRASYGKKDAKKDICFIAASHNIPYVAQAIISHPMDLIRKAKKAFEIEGACFLNVLAPCPRGWRYDPQDTIAMARLAVETCYFPLYEIENGYLFKLNYKPKEKKPLIEYLKRQGRFNHLFTSQNQEILKTLQEDVDRKWKILQNLDSLYKKSAT